jgi:hypothetical protein
MAYLYNWPEHLLKYHRPHRSIQCPRNVIGRCKPTPSKNTGILGKIFHLWWTNEKLTGRTMGKRKAATPHMKSLRFLSGTIGDKLTYGFRLKPGLSLCFLNCAFKTHNNFKTCHFSQMKRKRDNEKVFRSGASIFYQLEICFKGFSYFANGIVPTFS